VPDKDKSSKSSTKVLHVQDSTSFIMTKNTFGAVLYAHISAIGVITVKNIFLVVLYVQTFVIGMIAWHLNDKRAICWMLSILAIGAELIFNICDNSYYVFNRLWESFSL
jgi:hypothetical protein